MESAAVIILADDLSGAADCASAFAQAGFDTRVNLNRDALIAPSPRAQCVAFDADTRRLPGEAAIAIQRRLFLSCLGPGRRYYKKIDSTLRGHFAAELAAVADCAHLAIVAPAFPKTARHTRGGRQFLGGAPLEQTALWRAEGRTDVADIPAMLERAGLRAALLELDAVRRGPLPLRDRMQECAREGAQALICDAETEADLQAIVQAALGLREPLVWVGSAGLAQELALALGPPGAAPARGIFGVQGPILTVVGSPASASQEQARVLAESGEVVPVRVSAEVLLAGTAHPEWRQLAGALQAAFDAQRDVLVALDAGTQPRASGLLCPLLAQLVAPYARRLGAIVVTGGETARALLERMGIASLRLAGEIETGVPLALGEGALSLPVVTKAGAFGDAQTLKHCLEALRRRRSPIQASARAPRSTIPAAKED